MAQACYDTLWEAVLSVDGSRLWKTYLYSNGLNLVMDDEDYRGSIFVVRDAGLSTCNLTDIQEWPQGDCGQRIRELLSFLASDEGNAFLMFHWLPGETAASMQVDDDGYPTLLAHISGHETPAGTRIRFVDDNTVALLQGAASKGGRMGGYANATVVEQKYVCDPQHCGKTV